jgi:peptidyl-prolyl cis-trans isomerase SurA
MKWAATVLMLPFLLSIAIPARADEPELVNDVVAQVNNDIISRATYLSALRDLHEELKFQMEGKSDTEVQAEYENLKSGVLDSLIDDLLLEQRSKELGFDGDVEAEVNQHMLKVAQESNFKTVEELEKAMRAEGLLPEEARTSLRKQFQHQYVLSREVLQPLVGRGATTEQLDVASRDYLKKLREDAFIKITNIAP